VHVISANAGLFRNPADIAEEDERPQQETRERPTRPVFVTFGKKNKVDIPGIYLPVRSVQPAIYPTIGVLSTFSFGDHRVVCQAERHANRLLLATAERSSSRPFISDVCPSHWRQRIMIIRLHFSRMP
jgi:hypothetical protein